MLNWMSDEANHRRKMRQMLSTDRWLGLDALPRAERAPQWAEDSSEAPAEPVVGSPAGAPAGPRDHAAAAEPSPHPAEAYAMPPDDMTREQKIEALDALKGEVEAYFQENWPRDGWQNVAFGEGDPEADLMFIGEGPGAEEDKQGRPFVGRAGQLLDKQIGAMGLKREQVFIANIAKVRPPGNRVPTPEEAEKQMPYLLRQIEIIHPKVLVCLGATACKYLLENRRFAITRERGKWRTFHGIDLMPTFHPAYLLRAYSPENRRKVWEDLQAVMEKLGLPLPEQK